MPADSIAGFKKSAAPAPAAPFGGGAASAPAPAREIVPMPPAEISPAIADDADSILVQSSEVVAAESPAAESSAVESPEFVGATPTFTFGGANVPESSGGRKKVLLALAAAFVIVAAVYAGWSYLQSRSAQPGLVQPSLVQPGLVQPSSVQTSSTPAKTAPVAAPQPAKPANPVPNSGVPATSTSTTSTSTTSATGLPSHAASSEAGNAANSATSPDAGAGASPADNDASSKPSTSAASPSSKPARSDASPLVVKSGTTSPAHPKRTAPNTAVSNTAASDAAASDAAASSVPEIVMPGSSAPPPNVVGGAVNGPAPVLQVMNISQGVSQGLLIRKVQPQYPKNALTMHVEGAVQLMATVSASGNVATVKILSGDSLLTKAAVDAVKQWKYKPYRLNGQPVEIQTQITVNFALPH